MPKYDEESADVEPEKETPSDGASLVASIKSYVFSGVAGPWYQKVLYYVCLALAAISFMGSSVTIIRAAAEESITSVDVSLVDQVPMPAMFGCMPIGPEYPHFVPKENLVSFCPENPYGSVFYNTWGVGVSMGCFEWIGGYHIGDSDEVGYWKGSKKERAFLKQMLTYFKRISGVPHWSCFLGNGDGGLVSERASPVRVSLSMNAAISNTTGEFQPLVYLGLFDPHITGTLETIMSGNGQIYIGNMINSLNTMKISHDKLTDLRGGVKAVLSDGESTEEKITNLYSASVSSTAAEHVSPHKILTSSVKVYHCEFAYEVSTFISRSVTIRNKYLSEIWVQLGGAWASALLIITFFFYEKVGGSKGKIQMFRFNTARAKQELIAAANRELGGMLQEQMGEIKGVVKKQIGDIKDASGFSSVVPLPQPADSMQSAIGKGENAGVAQAIQDELKDGLKDQLSEKLQEQKEKIMSQLKDEMQQQVASQMRKILQDMKKDTAGDRDMEVGMVGQHAGNDLPGVPSHEIPGSVAD